MKLGVLPRSAWLVEHPELRGVFVGGCVDRGVGSRFRAKAHAHTHGEHRGWICFLSANWLHLRLMWLHELAHVVTREGHTARWRAFLLQIGGTLDKVYDGDRCVMRSYHPRSRPKVVERSENENGRFVTYDNGAVTMWPRTTSQVAETEPSDAC
jgi:hypothetical protein